MVDMPAKNSQKTYSENAFYHIYNRGVEKRRIFLDEQDVSVFLSYIATYLLPKDTLSLSGILANPDTSPKEKDMARKLLRMNNFSESMDLLAYCLMPNHFHFLFFQKPINAIDSFMNSLCTRYSMYFNKKYKRVGTLFQGVYKGVLVESDEQLLYLTRYIHRNPLSLLQGEALQSYIASSYKDYLRQRSTQWLKPQQALSFFPKKDLRSYGSFVEDSAEEEKSFALLADMHLDASD